MIPLVNLDNTCCFTGHRPNKLPWAFDEKDERCVALKTKMHDIIESVILSGMRHFICGMAQGCDMYYCHAGGSSLSAAGHPASLTKKRRSRKSRATWREAALMGSS